MLKPNFNQKAFTQFLIKAKQNTYAKSGEISENILADGSKELVLKEGEFEYMDRYFGFNPFIGQEIVFQNKQAIWAMNYYGRIISKKISASQVYQFLKQALSKVMADKPFRGLDGFKRGDFRYFNKAHGRIEKFSGKERIFYQDKLAYQLRYHGGAVASQKFFSRPLHYF
ncbi:MAG: DUF5680 domain-containing protein [Patescibacteria group bacterium]